LRSNPHLELDAFRAAAQQEEDTWLIADLQMQEKKRSKTRFFPPLKKSSWHIRVEKAKTAGRVDLAQAAQEREAALLREGNQRWGQMQG